MLTQSQVQRYTMESGLRDIMIAEKEIVLTFLLQLLSERGLLDRMAFKGGTCIRKMFLGNRGRFSTDLDLTGIEEHDHEDMILAMMEAFEQVFHGRANVVCVVSAPFELKRCSSYKVCRKLIKSGWGECSVLPQVEGNIVFRDSEFHNAALWKITPIEPLVN
jgi:hypothetical protein